MKVVKPLVGISSCLLGEKVRYDGAAKLDYYLRDVLGLYVNFISVCPELECGMGVPREAMRLNRRRGEIRLVTRQTETDLTAQMNKWMRSKLAELSNMPLCGYIFKSKSPSCGLFRVKVYRENERSLANERGIFASGVIDSISFLPAEEEGKLTDAKSRENFIERIFVMQRWHQINEGRKSLQKIMEFHSRHKYLLMAHCPKTLSELGAFLADGKKRSIRTVYEEYFEIFIIALGKIATVNKNTNVLLHVMGYFKNNLTKDEKVELRGIVDNYHSKLIPLIVPITLINHYLRKYPDSYLQKQYFLNPHPMELMLRNHV